MTSITVPVGHIRFEPGSDNKAPDPEQWLNQVIDQAVYVLNLMPELEARAAASKLSWPANIGKDCRVARRSAQEALQAISDEDLNTAALAIFHAGRAIEKATAALAIFGGLKYREGRAKQAREAGSKGGESARKLKVTDGELQYIFRHSTDEEKAGSLTLQDWCSRLKKNKNVTVSPKTMGQRLTNLGIPYKGKRK